MPVFMPKAAAHVAHHHPHVVDRAAGDRVGQAGAHAGGHLAGQAHRQPPVVDPGQHAARLHRRRRHALVHQVQRDVVRRTGKGRGRGCDVAVAHLGADVVGRTVPQHRRAGLQGADRVDVDRQVLGLDEDGVGRSPRRQARRGDDGHHRLADIAHAFVRQRALGRRGHRLAVGAHEGRRGGNGLDAGGDEVGTGVDRHHARRSACTVDVDGDNAAMGHRAAHESQEQFARGRHVVGVAALALHQGRVLDAAHGLAAAELRGDAVGAHRAPSFIVRAASCTDSTMLV
jgi:hypothetical protein